MRRERILMILGIWVAILPYLGFPYSWKSVLFTISGAILIYYSYKMHKENIKMTPTADTEPTPNTFSIADAGEEKISDNFKEYDNQSNNFDAGKNF